MKSTDKTAQPACAIGLSHARLAYRLAAHEISAIAKTSAVARLIQTILIWTEFADPQTIYPDAHKVETADKSGWR
ncbi:hypothetical protein HKX54_15490 [Sulfitobacter sp. M57]|uniref:hypothetical protein n=1 Tax=unclassified Sulfitobacter TaxID=196795 RepID=UPI0023E2EC3A|nr:MULTISPECIES: hypothetical protein [unclassified Sulfitobacter]MDF3415871.1 hypothetical protein [Sulfitobacter sp. KE5]MDF3423351.1 hypothetical protein [Sulfitobacter sp. KE43]MDF3434417.1 hypothetical protein [Sulfitobacter sp. KE42]MDF3460057.1 hypothetical protein [Sulfitobacter sp. S74]MDF3463955.1 hypothetical protein [Sulfitobacter sp. Ks18]